MNSLMIPIPPIHQADFAKWAKDCMKPDSVSVFPAPPDDPMPEALLDAYF